MEALRLAREQLNKELRRYVAIDEVPKAPDNDETPMNDDGHSSAWDNLRPTFFQKATIVDGTFRYGLRWIRCNVCGMNQPDYQVEKAQCHAACLPRLRQLDDDEVV